MIYRWSNIPARGAMMTPRVALGGIVMDKNDFEWRYHWVFVEIIWTKDISIN